jgi:hypothetical protein
MVLTLQIILLLIQLTEFLIPRFIPKKFLIPNFKAQIILSLVCSVGFGFEHSVFGCIVYFMIFGIVSYRLNKEIKETKEIVENENH